MNKNWLTINEIASYLNVSRTAIVNAINRKEIPTTRIGRRILIKQNGFQRYLHNIEIKGKNDLWNVVVMVKVVSFTIKSVITMLSD